MEILLQGLYKASQDENEQVVKQVKNTLLGWTKNHAKSCHVQINILLEDTQAILFLLIYHLANWELVTLCTHNATSSQLAW